MNFSNILIHWYLQSQRDLPWRKTKDPYVIWLSEIILQQTKVVQGLPYFETFLSHFPSVLDLANASEAKVLKLWEGLGYYSRARNLHASAKYIAFSLDQKFPNTYKDLLALKGVGDYTASAIASFAYDLPHAVVDGNVYRVLARYFAIALPINKSNGIIYFKKLAQQLLDKQHPSTHNQAIMEFGALQCVPKSPDCVSCPLHSGCLAFKNNTVTQLPVKIKASPVKKKFLNYLVFVDIDKATVLKKREGKGIWQGLYEFPCVETSHRASIEQIFLQIKQQPYYQKDADISLYSDKVLVHKLSHQHLDTRFWIITLPGKLAANQAVLDFTNYPVPVLIANFIKEFDF